MTILSAYSIHLKDRKKGAAPWPYVPNQPNWSVMPDIFAAAKTVNPKATGFIGQKDGTFYFQEWGNPIGVAVETSRRIAHRA